MLCYICHGDSQLKKHCHHCGGTGKEPVHQAAQKESIISIKHFEKDSYRIRGSGQVYDPGIIQYTMPELNSPIAPFISPFHPSRRALGLYGLGFIEEVDFSDRQHIASCDDCLATVEQLQAIRFPKN